MLVEDKIKYDKLMNIGFINIFVLAKIGQFLTMRRQIFEILYNRKKYSNYEHKVLRPHVYVYYNIIILLP